MGTDRSTDGSGRPGSSDQVRCCWVDHLIAEAGRRGVVESQGDGKPLLRGEVAGEAADPLSKVVLRGVAAWVEVCSFT
jgi:hypothetical protein